MLKYSFLILFLSSFAFQTSFGQKDSLSFTLNSFFPTYKYQKNGISVSSDDFYKSLNKNTILTEKFKAGKSTHVFGNVVANIGAFLIGWNIGQLMVNKNEKKNYTVGLIGVGALTVGLPVSWIGRNKSQKALVEFNNNANAKLYERQISNNKDEPEKIKPTISNLAESGEREMTPNEKFQSACIIVRIPVYGNKINLLTKKINDVNITSYYKSKLKNELDNTLMENKEYLSLVRSGFEQHFHVKNIYFLPDSSFKSHLAGNQTGFLNNEGTMDQSLQCQSKEIFYFITGKDKEQLLFVDKFLEKPSAPFPHKKNTFLPTFRKIFNTQKYINSQIIYFNEKLSKL